MCVALRKDCIESCSYIYCTSLAGKWELKGWKIPFKMQVFEGILWAKFDLRDSFGLITVQMSGG